MQTISLTCFILKGIESKLLFAHCGHTSESGFILKGIESLSSFIFPYNLPYCFILKGIERSPALLTHVFHKKFHPQRNWKYSFSNLCPPTKSKLMVSSSKELKAFREEIFLFPFYFRFILKGIESVLPYQFVIALTQPEFHPQRNWKQ